MIVQSKLAKVQTGKAFMATKFKNISNQSVFFYNALIKKQNTAMKQSIQFHTPTYQPSFP